MKGHFKKRAHKINSEIRSTNVRIIGDFNGLVLSLDEALKLAESSEKDLILINENANPAIVRIEDYNKFLYEIEKREKDIKKNSKKVELKEIKLSANIADHDLNIKSKKGIEFLEEGNKVKCSLQMKGRENNMKENSELVMLKFASLLESCGLLESLPKLEGTKWTMIVKPKK